MMEYPSFVDNRFQLTLLKQIKKAGGIEIADELRPVMLRQFGLRAPRGKDIERWRNILSWALIEMGPPTKNGRGKKWLRKAFTAADGRPTGDRDRWIEKNRPGSAPQVVWQITARGIAQLNGVGRPKKGDMEIVAAEADDAAEQGDFDPTDTADARRRAMRSIALRQGQPAFRRKLLKVYRGRCAFSGCTVSEILDAAHIVRYRGKQTNHPQNGLLLRTDLHTLFDLGRLAVDTRDMTIVVAPSLAQSDYARLTGKPVILPVQASVAPNKAALDQHRRRAALTRRSRRRRKARRV
jgi:hypothetical protein